MRKWFYRFFGRIRAFLYEPVLLKFNTNHDALVDSRFDEVKYRIALSMPENIVLKGFKCYSTGEEDGIIEAIFNIIPPSAKNFVEIGCGNGLENNTHYLLLKNWKGTWVDGNNGFIRSVSSFLGADNFKNLLLKCEFVTKENVVAIFRETQKYFNQEGIDFFSLDIDGTDYHVMEAVFESKIFPKAVCVEYNAKWGLGADVKVHYDPGFVWAEDDYMGVSLAAWLRLFGSNDYTLLCCDILGNNAFFIRDDYKHLFHLYDPSQLFQPPRYYLARRRSGHKSTLKMLKHTLAQQ